MFKETKTVLYSNKIKEDVKILLFSDIHYSGVKDNKKLDKVCDRVLKYDVDYICVSGDVVDSTDVLENIENCNYLLNFFTKIANSRKVFICIGNHDIYSKKNKILKYMPNGNFWKKLEQLENIYILDNKDCNSEKIYFMGYTASFDYYYKNKNGEDADIMLEEMKKHKISEISSNKYNILLMHSPIRLDNDEVKKKLSAYDLILCGHMHNGMIIPIIDELFDNNAGLIAPNKKFFPKIARGIKKDASTIIISSGITKLSRISAKKISWLNFIFPIGINYIVLSSGKDIIKKTFRYYK